MPRTYIPAEDMNELFRQSADLGSRVSTLESAAASEVTQTEFNALAAKVSGPMLSVFADPGQLAHPISTETVQAVFKVTLTKPAPAGGVAATYALTGTAEAGTHYTAPASTEITFAEGESSKDVLIDLIGIDGATETTLTASLTSDWIQFAPSATVTLLAN